MQNLIAKDAGNKGMGEESTRVYVLLLAMEFCRNEDCARKGRLMPLHDFSYCKIRGRIYRRGWCKRCEAERDRVRRSDKTQTKKAKEQRGAAEFNRMMAIWRRP